MTLVGIIDDFDASCTTYGYAHYEPGWVSVLDHLYVYVDYLMLRALALRQALCVFTTLLVSLTSFWKVKTQGL